MILAMRVEIWESPSKGNQRTGSGACMQPGVQWAKDILIEHYLALPVG